MPYYNDIYLKKQAGFIDEKVLIIGLQTPKHLINMLFTRCKKTKKEMLLVFYKNSSVLNFGMTAESNGINRRRVPHVDIGDNRHIVKFRLVF